MICTAIWLDWPFQSPRASWSAPTAWPPRERKHGESRRAPRSVGPNQRQRRSARHDCGRKGQYSSNMYSTYTQQVKRDAVRRMNSATPQPATHLEGSDAVQLQWGGGAVQRVRLVGGIAPCHRCHVQTPSANDTRKVKRDAIDTNSHVDHPQCHHYPTIKLTADPCPKSRTQWVTCLEIAPILSPHLTRTLAGARPTATSTAPPSTNATSAISMSGCSRPPVWQKRCQPCTFQGVVGAR